MLGSSATESYSLDSVPQHCHITLHTNTSERARERAPAAAPTVDQSNEMREQSVFVVCSQAVLILVR